VTSDDAPVAQPAWASHRFFGTRLTRRVTARGPLRLGAWPLLLGLALGTTETRAQAPAVEAPWAALDEIDGVEVAVDTVNYTKASDRRAGTTYRVRLRFQYPRRTAGNAELWDRGGRALLFDQDVFCAAVANGGVVDLRTHRVSVLGEGGTVLGEKAAPPEWITPPRGSAGASYGRAVCLLLPQVDRGHAP